LNRQFSKEVQIANKYMKKTFNILSHKRNENQNYTKLHSGQNGYDQVGNAGGGGKGGEMTQTKKIIKRNQTTGNQEIIMLRKVTKLKKPNILHGFAHL
jgi:DNA-binding transcriptional regulator YiaG